MLGSRQRRSVIVAAALAAVLGSVAAAQALPAPTPQRLPIGKWSAVGVAQGTATADLSQGRLELVARFQFHFGLVVGSDLAITGEWFSNGAANMTVAGQDGVLEQSYLGGGIAYTMGDEVVFDGTYNWSSVFRSRGQEVAVPAGELVPDVTLIVEGATCEEAWGQVAVRWEEDYEGAGWSPAFAGNWNGVLQNVPDDRNDYLVGLNQLLVDHNELMVPFRAGQPSQVDVAGVWDLIQRALPLVNEIRNLGECAERFFGPDNIEYWISALTSVVNNSILGIAMYQQPPITGYELLALVDAGLAVGAFGPGQVYPEHGMLADDLLAQRAQEIFAGALVAEGDPLEEGLICDSQPGCLRPTYDQAAAIVAGRHMGWDFTVLDGSTRSAAELLQRWSDIGEEVADVVREVGGG